MKARGMAKALGRRGGTARARRLSPAERQRIAALGGRARHLSMLAARRVHENFVSLGAVIELQGGPPQVKRMRTCKGPLPQLAGRKL